MCTDKNCKTIFTKRGSRIHVIANISYFHLLFSLSTQLENIKDQFNNAIVLKIIIVNYVVKIINYEENKKKVW